MTDKLDTKLANGDTSTIVQLPTFTPLALVCWGGLRLGGQVTVHLPCELVEYGASIGGLASCMPKWGANVLWTFEFGFEHWDGAILCKNCFTLDPAAPKAKRMPGGGWFTYAKKPKLEMTDPYKAAVRAILDKPAPRDLPNRSGPASKRHMGRRVVEI